MPDMNKVKGHPGFMPFGCANVKTNSSDTQSEKDKERAAKQEIADSAKGN